MKNKILLTLTALLLVLVMCFSITACFGDNPNTNISSTTNNNGALPNIPEGEPIDYTQSLLLIDALFKNYSIFKDSIDFNNAMSDANGAKSNAVSDGKNNEEATLAAIRAYVAATEDMYATFYDPEELEALLSENNGDLYGIGVQVIFDYKEYFMEIVLIMPDSPAQQNLEIGDKVTHIMDDGEKVALADIVAQYKAEYRELYPEYTDEEINNAACYDTFQYTVSKLKGPEGTYAEFTVVRGDTSYEMRIQRAKVKTVSVTCKTSIRDSKVGIVSILQFDLTTPTQFKDCMDSLIKSGCTKFIFDVRNNPGGDLASVTAVLSTLLQKDDVILSTKDSSGLVEVTKVKVVTNSGDYATCNVTSGDIAKYSKYEMVVLANENSASAAELFTAALRDHDKALIVGVNTYGKGSVQSIIPLYYYGDQYYGAIKLTTKLYFPPCGEGYDGGIGIAPDYPVELEGEAAEVHFYKLTEEIDNQLQKAVSLLID